MKMIPVIASIILLIVGVQDLLPSFVENNL